METLRGIGEAPRTIWKSSSIFLAGIAGDAVVRTRPRPRRGGARRLHQIVVEPAPVWLYVPDRRQVGGRGRPAARWALKSLAGARRRSQTGVARQLSSDRGNNKAGAAIGIITSAQIRSNGQNAPKGWTVFHLPSTPGRRKPGFTRRLAGAPPRPGRLLHRCNRPKESLCFFVPVEPRRWTLPCGVRFVAFGQTNQASGSVALRRRELNTPAALKLIMMCHLGPRTRKIEI